MNTRKRRIPWTQQKELIFVKTMKERLAEFQTNKKNSHIYKEMCVDFQKLGINITAMEIKHKLGNLTTKYRSLLTRMKVNPGACDKWPLFEDVRDIVETLYGAKHESNATMSLVECDTSSNTSETLAQIPNVNIAACLEVKAANVNNLMREHKRNRVKWTPEQELTFVCLWAERLVEFVSDKKNWEIYGEMSEQLEKLGLYVTPSAIKNKIHNLTMKYNKEKKLMETSFDLANKWILFDKMSDIIEHPFFQNLNEQIENVIEAPVVCHLSEPLHVDNDSTDSSYTARSTKVAAETLKNGGAMKKSPNWTPDEELALVNMWRECRAESLLFKRNWNICNKISMEFQKMGKQLTPKDIKKKIIYLVGKFKKAKKSMQLNRHVDIDWPLFNALRKIMENNNYDFNDSADNNFNVTCQADQKMLISCGQIQFSTQQLQFLYTCQFCEENTENVEQFLEHILKEHLILNEEQKQIYEPTSAIINNQIETAQFEVKEEDGSDNDEDCEYADKYYQEDVVKVSPTAEIEAIARRADIENHNVKTQEQLEEKPLNFEVFYFDEMSSTKKSFSGNEECIDKKNINKYVKIQGPVDINLEYMIRGQQGYECPHCKKCFQQKYKLTEHIRTRHLGIKRYACSICGHQFKEYSNMLGHVKRHLNIKPYLCSVCGKTFTSSTDLHTHTRMHTQEKPYECSECTMTFTTSSKLALHLRRHRNERPHVCEYCGKRFFTRKSWTNHIRTHTNERPFECSICKAKFCQKNTLTQHERLHTNMKIYACQMCDASFKQYAGLFGHMKRCSSKHNTGIEI